MVNNYKVTFLKKKLNEEYITEKSPKKELKNIHEGWYTPKQACENFKVRYNCQKKKKKYPLIPRSGISPQGWIQFNTGLNLPKNQHEEGSETNKVEEYARYFMYLSTVFLKKLRSDKTVALTLNIA